MAVGKGSMERASKAANKEATPKAAVIEAPVAEVKDATVKPSAKPAAKKTTKAPAKKASPVKEKAVITGTSKQVMEEIVYAKSSQVLDRDAKPNESFYVGDAMPVYFL